MCRVERLGRINWKQTNKVRIIDAHALLWILFGRYLVAVTQIRTNNLFFLFDFILFLRISCTRQFVSSRSTRIHPEQIPRRFSCVRFYKRTEQAFPTESFSLNFCV